MAVHVWRGAETGTKYSGYGWDAAISTANGPMVHIGFAISASGGNTNVLVGIDTDSFIDLARAMLRADDKEALSAFGTVLKEYADAKAPRTMTTP